MAMPDHLREILLLHTFTTNSWYKQISDILGIPLGTVKSRLHAAVALFCRPLESLKCGEPAKTRS
jgi:RNA polymerase sigma-70 factor (ECF subfamily)